MCSCFPTACGTSAWTSGPTSPASTSRTSSPRDTPPWAPWPWVARHPSGSVSTQRAGSDGFRCNRISAGNRSSGGRVYVQPAQAPTSPSATPGHHLHPWLLWYDTVACVGSRPYPRVEGPASTLFAASTPQPSCGLPPPRGAEMKLCPARRTWAGLKNFIVQSTENFGKRGQKMTRMDIFLVPPPL